MAGRFSVDATFSAIDHMTRPLKKMTGSTKRFTRGVKRDFLQAQRQVDSFKKSAGRSMGNALKRTAQIGIGAVVVGIGVATREFVEFDNAVTASTAKFKDLDVSTEAGMKTMEDLRKAARAVGAETQFSATEAAQGLDFLAMAGFTSVQAMKLLPGVVDLATVANTDLATATDIASDALGAFGLMSEDTATLQKNLNRIMDVSAKTTTMFNTDLETLFESVKKGAPAFTAAGQSLESFNTLAGVMANAGVKGAESGTQLRNVMLRLAKPTTAAQIAMDKLGVTTQDGQGDFRDVIDILADFEKGLVGMGTAQKTAALATVFGARSVTGINILLGEGTEKLREYREMLISSEGAAKKMADFMRGSLMNRFKILKSSAIELGFKFIEAFEKDGVGALKSLTEWVQNIDVKPIIDGFKTFFNVIRVVWSILGPILPAILAMVAAWKIYRSTLIAVEVVQQLMKASSPIGWILLAVAAVALLVTHWDLVVEGFKTFINWIVPALTDIGKTIMKYLLDPIDLVLTGIVKLMKLASHLPGIGGQFAKAANFVERMQSQRSASLRGDGATQGGRVQTQRDTLHKTISEKKSSQEIIIRNDSNNEVSSKGSDVGTGSSLKLFPSGGFF